jgi:hypothetical protein
MRRGSSSSRWRSPPWIPARSPSRRTAVAHGRERLASERPPFWLMIVTAVASARARPKTAMLRGPRSRSGLGSER